VQNVKYRKKKEECTNAPFVSKKLVRTAVFSLPGGIFAPKDAQTSSFSGPVMKMMID